MHAGRWGRPSSPTHWLTFGLIMFMVFGGWKLVPWFAMALGVYVVWTVVRANAIPCDTPSADKRKRKNDDADGFETLADEPLRQV